MAKKKEEESVKNLKGFPKKIIVDTQPPRNGNNVGFNHFNAIYVYNIYIYICNIYLSAFILLNKTFGFPLGLYVKAKFMRKSVCISS